MTVPTVRVANPKTASGYMLINASDYRESVHGPLWHTQEPGFDGRLPPPAPVQATSDEELRKAANLMFELMEAEREEKGLPRYASLTAHQRLTWLDKKREEFLEARSRYMRRMDSPEVVVPEGVIPGETPGWPVDLATGKPLWMPQEERERLMAMARHDLEAEQEAERQRLAREQAPPGGEGGETATSQPTPPPSQEPAQAPQEAAQPAPASGEQPAWLRPAQPAAQDTPPPPPVAEKSVEKGPGSKWYVMQAGKPVTEGFKTKAEAESQVAAAPKE